LNVTPEGSVPDSERVGAGDPVAVNVKEPAAPRIKVVVLPLVMAGAEAPWGAAREKPTPQKISPNARVR
jgi:hypothetical protein